jgi:methionine synthase I (cobalamin-dependent)
MTKNRPEVGGILEPLMGAVKGAHKRPLGATQRGRFPWSAPLLICDGAMGTQLALRGLPAGHPGELWNVECPGRVLDIHRAYLAAGADVVLTNTFGGSRWALERHGLADRLEALNAAGARLARQAAEQAGPPPRHVFADLGPTGELMAPLGARTAEEFEAVFAEQVRALVGTAAPPLVDAVLIETMIALDECAAAVRGAKAAAPVPVGASMAFGYNAARNAFFTPMGVTPAAMVAELTAAGADFLGVNCGAIDMAQTARLVAEIASLTTLPILAEPNAGAPVLRDGRTTYHQTPAEFAAGAPALRAAGARLIGGCCGTTPDHIAALVRTLRSAPDPKAGYPE